MNRKLKARIIEVYGSQADFSQAIGVDEARISRIVRNRRKLQAEEMERWAIECEWGQSTWGQSTRKKSSKKFIFF
jgi:plasmid maintenance system antidote protein VapI